jgi:hypothetical protein
MSDVTKYIEQYGKELINEVLNMAVINKSIDDDVMYELLVKYKVITRRTKHVRTHVVRRYHSMLHIWAKNTSGKMVFEMQIPDEQMPLLLKALAQ